MANRLDIIICLANWISGQPARYEYLASGLEIQLASWKGLGQAKEKLRKSKEKLRENCGESKDKLRTS